MEACAIATSWCAALSEFSLSSPCFPNKPASERYYRGGVRGFTGEFVGAIDGTKIVDMDQAWTMIRKIYEEQISNSEIAERLLTFGSITHAGIGIHTNEGRVRVAVAFVTRYGVVNPVTSSWISKEGIFLSGRLISNKYSLDSLILRADLSPRQAFTSTSPFCIDNSTTTAKTSSDTTELCRIEKSDIRFDKRGLKWTAPLNVHSSTPRGHYVLEIHLRQGEDTFLADNIVLDHPDGLPSLKPVTGVWIVADCDDDEDKKVSDEDLEPSSSVPPGAVWSTIGVASDTKHKNLKFCFESGESSSLSRKVITEIDIVKGEESQLSAPEGFSLIPVNLMFSSSTSFAYLCTKSTDPRPGIDVITEIVRVVLLIRVIVSQCTHVLFFYYHRYSPGTRMYRKDLKR